MSKHHISGTFQSSYFILSAGQTISNPSRTAIEEVYVFNPGEKVKVNVDEERLKALQEGHGGWNPRMIQVCTLTSKTSSKPFSTISRRQSSFSASLYLISIFKGGGGN